MTTPPSRPFLLVATAKEQAEQQGIIAGLRSHLGREELDWDIVPVPMGKTLGRQFLRRMTRHPGRRGVLIGRWRPEAPDIPTDRYPWIEWLADPRRLTGTAGVCFDVRAVARLAIKHLIDQGARTLAIAYAPRSGPGRIPEALLEHLHDEAAARNHAVSVLWRQEIHDQAERSRYYAQLAEFCARMPKPCGFFCDDDVSAEWLVSDLLHQGIAIPDEALVLGGSGSIGAACARIPLSSVRLPYHALGLAAALQAHRLLSGRGVGDPVITVGPVVVDARQSTARAAVHQHPILLRAERFIAPSHRSLPSVAQVASHCGCSRQYLLRCFRRTLHCSPEAWLRERAMRRAAELLSTTDLGLQAIAERCGMTRASSLSVAFKQHFGQPPGLFRYHHRGR